MAYEKQTWVDGEIITKAKLDHIEEGIEILTGVPAGKKDKNGHFPAGSINYLAYEKLKKYAEVSH